MLYPANMLLLYHASKLILYHSHRRLMKRACVRLAKLRRNRRWRMRRRLCFNTVCQKLGRERVSLQRTMCLEADCLAVLLRGEGITNATFRYPDVVSAIHTLAATQPKGFTAEPYLYAQLNAASSLPLHKDKNNFSKSWLLGPGSYEGGRLWIESPLGTEPPPCAASNWQKSLRAEYIDVKDRWVQVVVN